MLPILNLLNHHHNISMVDFRESGANMADTVNPSPPLRAEEGRNEFARIPAHLSHLR